MADNTVTVIGNVTRDPELRFTPSGQAIVTFGLAVNRRWQNRQTQEWEEQVSFFDVTCWAQLGQNVAVWGMGTFGVQVPKGIVQLSTTPPPPDPEADETASKKK